MFLAAIRVRIGGSSNADSLSAIDPKVWGGPGGFIGAQMAPFSVDGRAEFWIKLGPQEEVWNGTEDGTSLAAIGVRNGARRMLTDGPRFVRKFRRVLGNPSTSKWPPFIANRGQGWAIFWTESSPKEKE